MAWIIVNTGERAWMQLAYQFGHELGHVTTAGSRTPNPDPQPNASRPSSSFSAAAADARPSASSPSSMGGRGRRRCSRSEIASSASSATKSSRKGRFRHPEIYQHLINVLATRLRQTDEAVAAASFLTVQARLARALLELGKHVGQDDGAGHLVIRHKISRATLRQWSGRRAKT
jgi:hypothetical protein